MKAESLKMNCPKCGHSIKVDELLISKFKESVRQDFQGEMEEGLKLLQKEKIKNKKLTEQLVSDKKKLDEVIQKQLKSEIKKKVIEIRKQVDEENQVVLVEYQKLIADLKKKLTEVKQHAERSSQQLQGEAQELYLEQMLRDTFPQDQVVEIGKGVAGADVEYIIQTKTGHRIGSILFESKRTRSFSKGWIKKLKEDNFKLSTPADLLVIVSQTMPKNISKFGIQNGVWVCHPTYAKELTTALRYCLLKVYEVIQSQQSDKSRSDLIQFITSKEFQALLEGTLEGFSELLKSHNEEKLKMQRLWKGREKILEKLLSNTISLYGNLRAQAPDSFPEIESLEFTPIKKSA